MVLECLDKMGWIFCYMEDFFFYNDIIGFSFVIVFGFYIIFVIDNYGINNGGL